MFWMLGFCFCLWLLWRMHMHHEARVRERQRRCFHRYEAQQTLRVSSTHPLVGHKTGARFLVKHCRDCGLQTHRYKRLQPWDEYQREYAQESRDRAVEWAARKAAHDAELAAKRNAPLSGA